jgi:uncharacterized protein YqeY
VDPADSGHGSGDLRDRLRRALPGAMRARDTLTVAAVRSALAAIDNAEAVDAAHGQPPGVEHPDLAGTVAGLRAAEAERRRLTGAQMEEIVRAEVADREAAARVYEDSGQPEQAERLRGEVRILGSYLGSPERGQG